MYNCINEAIKYLKTKYHEKIFDRISNIDSIESNEDKLIFLLINQYYLGIQVRKELFFKLKDLGIIS